MFKNLTNVLTTNCEVIKFNDDRFIYPIFKNGRSSLTNYAMKNNLIFLKNKEISHLNKIEIFLRSPEERFASGIYTFFYLKGMQLNNNTLKKIEKFDIIDRHFVPQYLWLFHLHKYFSGEINIKSVDELYTLLPNRDGPWTGNSKPWKSMTQKEKDQILSIEHKKYVEVDKKMLKKYMNKSVKLKKIIEEFKI